MAAHRSTAKQSSRSTDTRSVLGSCHRTTDRKRTRDEPLQLDLVREQNRNATRKRHARALVRDFLATFALDADAGSAVVDDDVNRLIEEREQHRRDWRFADADRIRDRLAAHGVILEDSPTGVRWRRSTR
jgi:cysteinyl-tRNA synthetase